MFGGLYIFILKSRLSDLVKDLPLFYSFYKSVNVVRAELFLEFSCLSFLLSLLGSSSKANDECFISLRIKTYGSFRISTWLKWINHLIF